MIDSKSDEKLKLSSSARDRSKAKNKPSPGGPATKAEYAALKRVDKMVIKRMRKR